MVAERWWYGGEKLQAKGGEEEPVIWAGKGLEEGNEGDKQVEEEWERSKGWDRMLH